MDEHYTGCLCREGRRHPDCDQHREHSMAEAEAAFQVAEFLKKREEEKK